MIDDLKMRVHGEASLPTLVYLPGMHGDWTLVSSFRAAIAGRVRFVEFTYPRTTTWSLDEYASGIEGMLLAKGIERGWLLGESFGSQPAWQMVGHFLNRQGAQYGSRPTPCPSLAGSEGSDAFGQFPAREGLDVGFSRNKVGEPVGFQTQGLILAGGFVRHPVIWAVRMAGGVSSAIPMGCVKLFCVIYASYAKFRHKRAPETLASIAEFVANRTMEADRRGIVHRYRLISENDLRLIVRQTHCSGFYLA